MPGKIISSQTGYVFVW